jgi:periplasmic copper chaperone A
VRVFIRTFLSAVAAALLFTSIAAAHVSLNPGEWEAGGFARFAIRVPNESDAEATVKVTVQLPESVISVRFQPKPGWKRTVKMETLAEPIEEEGEEPITERMASVTWSGGSIGPGEFDEFGISFQVPDTPGEELAFPAIQTYSDGEVVRWIGPSDSEEPAPIISVTEPTEEEGGQPAASPQPPAASGGAAPGEDEGTSGLAVVALIVGIAALAAGLGALALVWTRTPRGTPATRS